MNISKGDRGVYLINYHELLGLTADASQADVRRAYRALAKKWHPDRYAEGPEREWAQERMIEINLAYNALIRRTYSPAGDAGGSRFHDIRLLIDAGELSRARKIMTDMTLRDAEWNYHFGLMLCKRADYQKAVTYLSIAVHQAPEKEEYKKELRNAKLNSIKKRFHFLRKPAVLSKKKAK